MRGILGEWLPSKYNDPDQEMTGRNSMWLFSNSINSNAESHQFLVVFNNTGAREQREL